jgi:hypothetical protein
MLPFAVHIREKSIICSRMTVWEVKWRISAKISSIFYVKQNASVQAQDGTGKSSNVVARQDIPHKTLQPAIVTQHTFTPMVLASLDSIK